MSDESLFREVDEEVRREQINKIWQRYGTLIMAACFGVVIAVAGLKGWQWWQRHQAEQAGLAWYEVSELLAAGRTDEARGQLARIAAGGHPGYSALARFEQAATLAEAGSRTEALAALDALAADGRLNRPMRDLARVRAAYLVADTASVADLEARLAGLDAATSPWRNAVREVIALAAWRAGDYAAADRAVRAILADPAAPANLVTRAQLLASLLEPLVKSEAG